MKWKLAALLLGVAGALTVGPVHAGPITFSCVSLNNATNCATGSAQMSVTVTQGAGFVDFLFANDGPLASSIADVYFDWLNPANAFTAGAITSSAGVSFSWGAAPPNLPAGNNAVPAFTADLAADSNAPAAPNGVNPGEWVNFRLLTDSTSVFDQIASGELRFGLHVQAFANGGSESFVNDASSVPEPGTVALLGAGMIGLFAARRRRAR